MVVRALAVYQTGLLCSLPFQGSQTGHFKALNFGNLRSLTLVLSSRCMSILPPPEFLSSITLTHLSKIVIDITVLPPEELDEVLDAIRGYDQALCQLADQLDPSSGSEKLILTLRMEGELPDPAAFLPQLSKFGILEIEVTGL